MALLLLLLQMGDLLGGEDVCRLVGTTARCGGDIVRQILSHRRRLPVLHIREPVLDFGSRKESIELQLALSRWP